jgi:hypothetical protein
LTYILLADAVVVLHLLFILFVLGGGLLVLRWRRLLWLHLPAAAWGALVEATGWICPLTPLENRLREMGSGPAYQGDFVARYVAAIVYPERLTQRTQLLLGAIVVVANAVIYAFVWKRGRRSGDPEEGARPL